MTQKNTHAAPAQKRYDPIAVSLALRYTLGKAEGRFADNTAYFLTWL